MNKQQLFRISRKVHKWVGLFIGIQVLFWIVGGLIMSSIPLEKVHGDHLHNKIENQQTSINKYQVSLNAVLNQNQLNPSMVNFYQIDDIPVYEIKDKQTYIYSGLSGELVQPLAIERVKSIATKLFTGMEVISSIEKIDRIPLEASRLKGPVWQVTFDDNINTTFYINEINGQLLTVRSDLWRLFDFVWMLHIMDYDTRKDFNNPLLITFAASALIFTISGLILLFQSFRRKNLGLRIKSPLKEPAETAKF